MANSNEYMSKYMLERYHRRRYEAIQYLGGVCIDCQTVDNLEIDHADPSEKTFNIAKALTSMAEATLYKELESCVLRCTTCHIDKTRNENPKLVSHGEGLTGKRNCRCDLCAPLKRAYQRKQQ